LDARAIAPLRQLAQNISRGRAKLADLVLLASTGQKPRQTDKRPVESVRQELQPRR